eukprot:jgi/Chlat1/7077/Chrsp57S06768
MEQEESLPLFDALDAGTTAGDDFLTEPPDDHGGVSRNQAIMQLNDDEDAGAEEEWLYSPVDSLSPRSSSSHGDKSALKRVPGLVKPPSQVTPQSDTKRARTNTTAPLPQASKSGDFTRKRSNTSATSTPPLYASKSQIIGASPPLPVASRSLKKLPSSGGADTNGKKSKDKRRGWFPSRRTSSSATDASTAPQALMQFGAAPVNTQSPESDTGLSQLKAVDAAGSEDTSWLTGSRDSLDVKSPDMAARPSSKMMRASIDFPALLSSAERQSPGQMALSPSPLTSPTKARAQLSGHSEFEDFVIHEDGEYTAAPIPVSVPVGAISSITGSLRVPTTIAEQPEESDVTVASASKMEQQPFLANTEAATPASSAVTDVDPVFASSSTQVTRVEDAAVDNSIVTSASRDTNNGTIEPLSQARHPNMALLSVPITSEPAPESPSTAALAQNLQSHATDLSDDEWEDAQETGHLASLTASPAQPAGVGRPQPASLSVVPLSPMVSPTTPLFHTPRGALDDDQRSSQLPQNVAQSSSLPVPALATSTRLLAAFDAAGSSTVPSDGADPLDSIPISTTSPSTMHTRPEAAPAVVQPFASSAVSGSVSPQEVRLASIDMPSRASVPAATTSPVPKPHLSPFSLSVLNASNGLSLPVPALSKSGPFVASQLTRQVAQDGIQPLVQNIPGAAGLGHEQVAMSALEQHTDLEQEIASKASPITAPSMSSHHHSTINGAQHNSKPSVQDVPSLSALGASGTEHAAVREQMPEPSGALQQEITSAICTTAAIDTIATDNSSFAGLRVEQQPAELQVASIAQADNNWAPLSQAASDQIAPPAQVVTSAEPHAGSEEQNAGEAMASSAPDVSSNVVKETSLAVGQEPHIRNLSLSQVGPEASPFGKMMDASTNESSSLEQHGETQYLDTHQPVMASSRDMPVSMTEALPSPQPITASLGEERVHTDVIPTSTHVGVSDVMSEIDTQAEPILVASHDTPGMAVQGSPTPQAIIGSLDQKGVDTDVISTSTYVGKSSVAMSQINNPFEPVMVASHYIPVSTMVEASPSPQPSSGFLDREGVHAAMIQTSTHIGMSDVAVSDIDTPLNMPLASGNQTKPAAELAVDQPSEPMHNDFTEATSPSSLAEVQTVSNEKTPEVDAGLLHDGSSATVQTAEPEAVDVSIPEQPNNQADDATSQRAFETVAAGLAVDHPSKSMHNEFAKATHPSTLAEAKTVDNANTPEVNAGLLHDGSSATVQAVQPHSMDLMPSEPKAGDFSIPQQPNHQADDATSQRAFDTVASPPAEDKPSPRTTSPRGITGMLAGAIGFVSAPLFSAAKSLVGAVSPGIQSASETASQQPASPSLQEATVEGAVIGTAGKELSEVHVPTPTDAVAALPAEDFHQTKLETTAPVSREYGGDLVELPATLAQEQVGVDSSMLQPIAPVPEIAFDQPAPYRDTDGHMVPDLHAYAVEGEQTASSSFGNGEADERSSQKTMEDFKTATAPVSLSAQSAETTEGVAASQPVEQQGALDMRTFTVSAEGQLMPSLRQPAERLEAVVGDVLAADERVPASTEGAKPESLVTLSPAEGVEAPRLAKFPEAVQVLQEDAHGAQVQPLLAQASLATAGMVAPEVPSASKVDVPAWAHSAHVQPELNQASTATAGIVAPEMLSASKVEVPAWAQGAQVQTELEQASTATAGIVAPDLPANKVEIPTWAHEQQIQVAPLQTVFLSSVPADATPVQLPLPVSANTNGVRATDIGAVAAAVQYSGDVQTRLGAVSNAALGNSSRETADAAHPAAAEPTAAQSEAVALAGAGVAENQPVQPGEHVVLVFPPSAQPLTGEHSRQMAYFRATTLTERPVHETSPTQAGPPGAVGQLRKRFLHSDTAPTKITPAAEAQAAVDQLFDWDSERQPETNDAADDPPDTNQADVDFGGKPWPSAEEEAAAEEREPYKKPAVKFRLPTMTTRKELLWERQAAHAPRPAVHLAPGSKLRPAEPGSPSGDADNTAEQLSPPLDRVAPYDAPSPDMAEETPSQMTSPTEDILSTTAQLPASTAATHADPLDVVTPTLAAQAQGAKPTTDVEERVPESPRSRSAPMVDEARQSHPAPVGLFKRPSSPLRPKADGLPSVYSEMESSLPAVQPPTVLPQALAAAVPSSEQAGTASATPQYPAVLNVSTASASMNVQGAPAVKQKKGCQCCVVM